MSDANLGKLLDATVQRDAIHIAIAPVVAAERLQPGAHVGLNEQGEATSDTEGAIGIVDPFLKQSVLKGERFYLCMHPRTIKNLRHDWSHDAVPDRVVPSSDSTAWVTAFAARWDYTFDELMAGAREYVKHDYELDDKWKQLDIEESEWAIFWEHFHTLTGLRLDADRDKGFVTCCA
jgi:hypothetical protein